MIFSNGNNSTASWTHSTTESSLIVEASDDHKILDEDTYTWLDNRIENMPSDSTFNAEEDANLDVSELANIFTDDAPQKSISKGKKKMTPLVGCIDDANDADGKWVWK